MDRFLTRLIEPVDAASMVAVRVAFGALMALGVVRFWAMGWIEAQYVAPEFYFPYWGFAWVQPLSSTGMHAVFGVMLVAAVGIATGVRYRLSALLFFAAFTWVELVDRTNYLNHYYLVSIVALMLVLMPLGGRPTTVPQWTVLTLRLQLGLVYTFAGVAKLNPDWLLNAQPLTIWLEARQGLPLVGPLLAHDATAVVMAWGGALFDLTVFAALSWSRTRSLAYAGVVVFHLLTWLLFPIGMFPWLMIALTTVFFAPSWPRRFVPKWRSNDEPAPRAAAPTARDAVIIALLAAHFVVQLVVPARSLAYRGNDHWHMQAFRFSWKVMLVEKTGMVEYRVVQPSTGRRWVIAPGEALTVTQYRMLAMQPDMILTYAHHIADTMQEDGVTGVQVYADAWASLNGRPSRRLIDPSVDLAAERDGLHDKAWIVPEYPPH